MSEMGKSRSLREYRDQLRDTIGRLEAEMATLEHAFAHATSESEHYRLSQALAAKVNEVEAIGDSLDTIESELATRAAGSGHLPE